MTTPAPLEEQPLVQFDRVTLAVDGRTYLRNVDLTVNEGEALVVAGPPGCGKSFLPRLILGLPGMRKESIYLDGEVRVAGHNIMADNSAADMQRLRRQMGSVLRGGGLIENMDIRRNITLPLNYHYRDVMRPAEIDARCDSLLEDMDLSDLAIPGRRPVGLNREERLYASLARALINEPFLLMLDEPTAGLSPMSAQRLTQFLFYYQPEFATHADAGGLSGRRLTRLVTSVDLGRYLRHGTRFAVLDDQRLTVVGDRQATAMSDDPSVRDLLSPYGGPPEPSLPGIEVPPDAQASRAASDPS